MTRRHQLRTLVREIESRSSNIHEKSKFFIDLCLSQLVSRQQNVGKASTASRGSGAGSNNIRPLDQDAD
jgi:hypothetical protein